MAGIFISYRHVDIDTTFLLQYWLKEHFGQGLIFWDKQDIPAGAKWAEVIRERVRSANALIAFIGPGWIDERKRLKASDDWVRVEIASALAGKTLVVPVLGSQITLKDLSPDRLPKDLKQLPARQSLSMADMTFHARLMEALEKAVPKSEAVDIESVLPRVGRLLLNQVARLQIRAVELIQDGRTDRAVEELHEGFSLMMELIQIAPPGLNLDVQLGFLYKTIAQAFDAAGNRAEADHYLGLAYSAFLRVKEAGPGAGRSAQDIAGALNGIGNVYQGRGQFDEAVRYYRLAVEIEPRYGYAWHDMFSARDARARQGGPIDLATMREALAKVIETGAGLPGLGQDKIALLRGCLAHWEQAAGSPKTGAPKSKSGARAKAKRR
jgi:tetratricopeptide (TPR) repeat protein